MFCNDDENSNENDEIEELKTFSIEESIKMRKAKRLQEKEAFEKRLAELQKRTDELKKQIKDERT